MTLDEAPVVPDLSSKISAPCQDAPSPVPRRYGLSLLPSDAPGDIDPAAVVCGAIVRVVRGPHAGIVGFVQHARGGIAWIASAELTRKRRRRVRIVQFDTALRDEMDIDIPVRNPAVGDAVFVRTKKWCGKCRIVALHPESATVVSSTWSREGDVSADVDLVTTAILEVLVQPVVHLPNGTAIALGEKAGCAVGEVFLDLYNQGMI
jgi:hypothetical protein